MRLEEVHDRMAAAARRSGRSPAAVRLVAVTKGVAVETIGAAVRAGVLDLGENRVQEARAKQALLPEGPRWHLIGRLQRNKAREAVHRFHLIHSLDRWSLAEELMRHSDGPVAVLIQVNVGRQSEKGGVAPEALAELVDRCRSAAGLRIRGLMAIAPQGEDPRPHFARLRELGERHGEPGWELSMGMSADFEAAIEEGATMVRVGTALFGPRLPHKDVEE